jgi:hypothetical protein
MSFPETSWIVSVLAAATSVRDSNLTHGRPDDGQQALRPRVMTSSLTYEAPTTTRASDGSHDGLLVSTLEPSG